jgi:hypothetical protein
MKEVPLSDRLHIAHLLFAIKDKPYNKETIHYCPMALVKGSPTKYIGKRHIAISALALKCK